MPPVRQQALAISATIVLSSIALLPNWSRADEGATGTEFERLLAGFGQINTIAGRGVQDRPSDPTSPAQCNLWNTSMEAGPAGQAELSRPHMAQADAAGNVYIADKEGHAVRMVTPAGTIHTVAGNGVRGNGGEGVGSEISLREPNGVFTFADGTTYILEIDGSCAGAIPGGTIRRLGTDGMLTTIVDDPSLFIGRGLWVSPDESLIYYCSGISVKKWTADNGIETFASGFSQLGNLDIDPVTGLVCVTDRGAHRVYRISADGSVKTVIAGTGGTGNGSHGQPATSSALEQVRGIAFRPDGSFFVCTHKGDHAVWFVDTAGLIWKFIDGQNNAHSGDGSQVSTFPQNVISEPRAITIAPNGDLLITEKDEGHIRRITNTCVETQITDFVVQPGSATITFRSHREGNYSIQQSSDLQDWQVVLDVETSNGPSTTVTVGPVPGRDYFRVLTFVAVR